MKNLNVIEFSPKDKIILNLIRIEDNVINIVERFEFEDINYKNGKILKFSPLKEKLQSELKKFEDLIGQFKNIITIYDKPTIYKKKFILKSKEEKKIRESDIENMMNLIKEAVHKDKKEIIHFFKNEFYLDDKKVSSPVGEKGRNLIGIFTVCAIEKEKINLLNSLFDKKDSLIGLFLSPLILVNGIKDSFSKNFIIEIEERFTYAILGYDNIPYHIEYFDVGVRDVLRDLSYVLEIPPRDTEEIVYKKGALDSKIFIDPDYPISIEKKVASMRIYEILEMIEKKIKRLSFKFYPEEIVLCGEGAKIKNIKEFTKDYFNLPVSIAESIDYKSELKLDNIDIIPVIGAVRSIFEEKEKSSFFSKFFKIFEKIFE
jgi:cell division ATPase FtsA